MKLHSKIAISLIGIALALLAQSRMMDDIGLSHTEQGLSRALVTYSISRGLNGVISVVQGTEVAIEPVGVGMTFTPGQILDPINDLIERFSGVVLVSGTAFGIQRVFLEITASPIFTLLILAVLALALAVLWFAKNVNPSLKRLVYKSAVVLLIVRFSVPMIAIVSENFYQTFLAPQFEISSQQLLSTTDQLQEIQAKTDGDLDKTTGEPRSFLDSARELVKSATNSFNVRQHLDDFTQAAESISEHAIRLIVIFVFQTIIVPLGSAWLLLLSIKWIIGLPRSEKP